MMTSLEIAEVTGKQHKNVMQAIRKMEPAWEKVHGLKFQLMFREVEIGHGAVRQDPCYLLTKTESLYIATKFNDEARAKLVLRWEFLERERLAKQPQQLALPSPQEILALADDIIGKGLRMLNEPAEDTLTATQVAKTFKMTGEGTLDMTTAPVSSRLSEAHGEISEKSIIINSGYRSPQLNKKIGGVAGSKFLLIKKWRKVWNFVTFFIPLQANIESKYGQDKDKRDAAQECGAAVEAD